MFLSFKRKSLIIRNLYLIAVAISMIFTIVSCSNNSDKNPESDSSSLTTPDYSTFDYITDRRIISPSYGNTVPVKGERRIDPVTGIAITRLTDASELDGTNDAFIVYSRYSPENTNGDLLLVFGGDSNSSWVIERSTFTVITELKDHQGHRIGEYQEVRWDMSGDHPNRAYFRTGMGLYCIDDVTQETSEPILIRDFSSDIPNASLIYNDVEGDSSNDADHWAFMAVHYNGTTYVVDAYVHYQISTDTTHILTPADLTGSNLDGESDHSMFSYRPNMVEITPDGTGFVMHHSRKWDDSSYGGQGADWIGTWYDGAWLWPLDFDWNRQPPQKISVDATHSGWTYDKDGHEVFISQNNRTDHLDAVTITGNPASFTSNYNTRDEIARHSDLGWSNGFHYGKVSMSKSGWAFVNTYSNVNNGSHNTDWAADQFLMVQLKPESENPIIWRIGHNYNRYDGSYRDEAPAALNQSGNRIYVSNNWGGQLNHREVFVYELPTNWNVKLEEL